MPAKLVVALDIGTSSVRALAFDEQGHKQGDGVQIEYNQTTSADGGVETDADTLLDLTGQCLDQLLPGLDGTIVAVGISCFWHSLIALDHEDKPLTGVLSWADNRSAAVVTTLRSHLSEHEVHARTGCVFHASYWPAKLLWLKETHSDIFANAKLWLGFGEYLALRWSGARTMGLSMASGTGLFRQNECDWDEAVLREVGLTPEKLPALCDASQALPELRADLLERWPQLKGAPWFPALGDGACSNIGSGCASPDKIALNAGTSGALRVVLPDYTLPAPKGLWRYRIDSRRSLVGGALSNAGNVLAWARATFQIPENWQQQVAAMEPGKHGLTVLPFLAGERAPLWNANARFVLEGASLDTDAPKIIRAILEGAALRFAAVGHLLLLLAPEAQIVFSGGALEKVPVWQAIVSDALGASLLQSCESEASARGAALMALESAGILTDVATVPFQSGSCIEPNSDHHATYLAALERQDQTYRRLYL